MSKNSYIKQKEELTELVLKAEINEILDLSKVGHILKEVSFSRDEYGYIWTARGRIGFIFPMKTNTRVKYFKTIIGAKSNFLRKWSDKFSFRG
jgi:hypothetical protein